MSLLILVVDDEPDVELLFRQQFRRDLRAGRFTIPEVPVGRYTYHAWRSGADVVTSTVVVGDGQPLEVSWR